MKKAIVAMSGGVDSSVAAHLMQQAGYDVTGVMMKLFDNGGNDNADDARKVAERLGAGFEVFDMRSDFRDEVIDKFVASYERGETPNPCVFCNKRLKFDALYEYGKEAVSEGSEEQPVIATGHYAKVGRLDNGRFAIQRSESLHKDQTYALYNLTQEQLSHTLMPVGAYHKDEIRKIAEEVGLPVAHKRDSQEICFIPDNDYAGFIDREVGDAVPGEGNFVTKDGEIIGRHKGITHYTVGQRRGLNIPYGKRIFVTEIRPETNEVVVGSPEDVFTDTLIADHVNYMGLTDFDGRRLLGKIRYGHAGAMCTVENIGAGRIRCHFEEPVRAVTPGQAVVLYDGDFVAGGGIITGK